MTPNNTLQLKFRIQEPTFPQLQEENKENKDKIGRRTKERKIGQIIELVAKWRKLYNGITDPNGELKRMSLDDAAIRVGISKKSLDDYFLQLRFGRKYGFNFNAHKHDKVGILRGYIKNCRNIEDKIKEFEDLKKANEDVNQKTKEIKTCLLAAKKKCNI